MVEYTSQLDSIFGSLSDPTRRDILKRLMLREMSVSEVAEPYKVSLAAISKHLKILQRASLIVKRRVKKQQIVQIAPEALHDASKYLQHYRKVWEDRLDSLEQYLRQNP